MFSTYTDSVCCAGGSDGWDSLPDDRVPRQGLDRQDHQVHTEGRSHGIEQAQRLLLTLALLLDHNVLITDQHYYFEN